MLTVGSSKKLDPTLNTSPMSFFAYRLYCNYFLRLKSWDFAFVLGLANMCGTWDLMSGSLPGEMICKSKM